MTAEWHYSQGGQQHGPVSSSELKQLAASGMLLPSDLVWKEGMEKWQPAAKLKGLSFNARLPVVQSRSVPPSPTFSNDRSTDGSQRAIDEKFCESCGKPIKVAAVICPNCGVKQKTAGIVGFFRKQIDAIKARVTAARNAIDEEMRLETGISAPHKVVAVIVALSAGWTGLTGLGSIVAGRSKAGFGMLGLPLFLGVLTVGCLMATFISAIMSIFVIGIPFFIVFGSMLTVLMPLFVTTWVGFYIADVVICAKAK